MKRRHSDLTRAAVWAGSFSLIVACSAGNKEADSGLALLQETQTAPSKTEEPAAPMDLKTQIEFSRKDLAQRLGITLDSINVSGARPVDWPSGAVGCPEPGMNYTQALVPGALIFLKVGNEVYGYHAKRGGTPFYCPRERAEAPVYGQGADVT